MGFLMMMMMMKMMMMMVMMMMMMVMMVKSTDRYAQLQPLHQQRLSAERHTESIVRDTGDGVPDNDDDDDDGDNEEYR